ncbi:MAG: glycosyltransferase [Deltaproteobacteria bacterium]|nr:glycosyltransferase [Deltaproteobacteria bacterium]
MTKTIPKISVVVPCYNSELFIKETIASILSNMSNEIQLEIIAINDCSTDRTIEILKGFGDVLKVIDKVINEGACRARNDGIMAASGEFIALCDHDDIWEPDKLIRQLEKFSDPYVGLVCSDADSFNEHGVLIASMATDRPLKRGMVFHQLLCTNFIIQSSAIIRKEVFEEAGLFNEQIFPAEDLDLWLRITQKWHVNYVEKVLVHYRISSTMYSRDKIRMKQARIPVIINYAKKMDSAKVGRKIISIALREFGMDYWYDRQFIEARRKLKEAVKYDKKYGIIFYLLLTYLPPFALNTMLLLKQKLLNRAVCL